MSWLGGSEDELDSMSFNETGMSNVSALIIKSKVVLLTPKP
jgi:hypothetical protein